MAGIRTFVAVKLDEEIVGRLDRLMKEMRPAMPDGAVRWVPSENVHLTLKFLGDVAPTKIDAIISALRELAADSLPFSMQLIGLGCFPHTRRPRVVWAGVEEKSGALAALAAAVDASLSDLGFSREGRDFSPHLTLGRARREASSVALRELGEAVECTQLGTLGEQEVRSIHLFKSDLRPSGSVYTSLAELPLGRG